MRARQLTMVSTCFGYQDSDLLRSKCIGALLGGSLGLELCCQGGQLTSPKPHWGYTGLHRRAASHRWNTPRTCWGMKLKSWRPSHFLLHPLLLLLPALPLPPSHGLTFLNSLTNLFTHDRLFHMSCPESFQKHT